MTIVQRLARRLSMPHLSLHAKLLIALGCALSLYGGASALAALGDEMLAQPLPSGNRVSADIVLDDLAAQTDRLAAQTQQYIASDTLRAGDTIAAALQRLHVDDPQALAFVRNDATARRLYDLRPGRTITAQTDANGTLQWLQFPVPGRREADAANPGTENVAPQAHVVRVERTDGQLRAAEQSLAPQARVEMRSGTITSSLFAATDAADVPDAITMQIAEIFDSEIDFHVDLRRGDTFRVVYETLYLDGTYLRPGRVLAVEFVNAGTPYSAYWFESAPGKGSYYAEDGQSLRKAFLRSPIEFSRVSSGFSDNRLHPIHLRWQRHTGVDYAAPTGTPIRAVADGVIDFVGVKNGYGKVVVVRHSGVYETLYAHMSRFGAGIARGTRVAQGQVIGHVGMTGWATGPHLHYEFHINGQPHDPLRVALPEAAPLPADQRAAFTAHRADLDAQLALLRMTPVASR